MLHNKLEDVLRMVELSRANKLQEVKEGNSMEPPRDHFRDKDTYPTENKPSMESTKFNLAFDLYKKEIRDMKLKCEQLSKQLRSKDIQLLNLQTAVEASKNETQQTTSEPFAKEDNLKKYCAELEVCAKLVHSLNEEGEQEHAELTDLLNEYRRATNKLNKYVEIMKQQSQKLEQFATLEKSLLHQLSECKCKILSLECSEQRACAEKEQQSLFIRELLATIDTRTLEVKEERTLNCSLVKSLAAAERENAATLTTMQDSTALYTRTVDTLNARIAELQSSLRKQEEELRSLSQQRVDTSSVLPAPAKEAPVATATAAATAAAAGCGAAVVSIAEYGRSAVAEVAPLSAVVKEGERGELDGEGSREKGRKRSRSRSNTRSGDDTCENAAQKRNRAEMPSTAATPSLELPQGSHAPPPVLLSSCCPVCTESPCGLMVRCISCGQGYHSLCSRRSGGSRAAYGSFVCKFCPPRSTHVTSRKDGNF